jgi:phosphatidylglycerol:prolipoprotein diacylglycerol transferase
MLQVLFRIPALNWPIYSYGLMMVIGFLGAIQLAKFLAKRSGIDPELFVTAGLLALVAGVAGARLSHVIENFHQYTDPHRSAWANFIDAVNIRSGGLTYYGGFLLAFPTLVWYALKAKIPLRLGMDIVGPCLMIGLGFGRIGCFLNGCCYGDKCELPWAVHFPYDSLAYEDEYARGDVAPPPELQVRLSDGSYRLLTRDEIRSGYYRQPDPVTKLLDPIDPEKLAAARQIVSAEHSEGLHPAQLYSAFTAFLIAGIVLAYFTLPHAPGRAFALMLILEGITRYILELLRVEPPVVGNFSLSMILGIGLAGLGVLLWFIFGRLASQPDEKTDMTTAPAAV